MKLINITIEEFEEKLYNEYVKIFPKEEQRNWENIKNTYEQGIEKFYIIEENENVLGFIMLEKNNKNNSYDIDYFAILKKYRNKGLGTKAIKFLLKDIIKDNLLCIEIEKPLENSMDTIRRKKFYIDLGFKEINSEYLLYNVAYVPLVYYRNETKKEFIDKMMFEYYTINCGEEAVKSKCKIVK